MCRDIKFGTLSYCGGKFLTLVMEGFQQTIIKG